MVVNEQSNVEVLLVVEGTANLSLYAETLKTNYILPALEYVENLPPPTSNFSTLCNFAVLDVFLAVPQMIVNTV